MLRPPESLSISILSLSLTHTHFLSFRVYCKLALSVALTSAVSSKKNQDHASSSWISSYGKEKWTRLSKEKKGGLVSATRQRCQLIFRHREPNDVSVKRETGVKGKRTKKKLEPAHMYKHIRLVRNPFCLYIFRLDSFSSHRWYTHIQQTHVHIHTQTGRQANRNQKGKRNEIMSI